MDVTSKQQLTIGLLVGLALLAAGGPFAIDMYLAALPQIGPELGTEPRLVQLTLSGFMLGMAVGQLVMGGLSDGLGRKKLMIFGSLLALAASVVCAIAPGIGVLIGARAVEGLGMGTCVVLSRAVIPDLAKGKEAAKAFTLMMVIQGVAPVLAPVLGGLLAEPIGWRGIFWFLVVVAAIQFLVATFVVKESHPVSQRGGASLATTLRGYVEVLRTPAFAPLALVFCFGFAMMFAYISASSFVIQEQLGFSPRGYSLVFALNSLGLMACGFINNRLIDRFSPARILLVALCVILGAGLLLAAVIVFGGELNAWTMLPLLFCTIAPVSVVMGNSAALATGTVRSRAGAGSAILGFFQFLLGSIVAPLASVGDDPSRAMAFAMLVCAAVALAAMLVARRRL